MRVDGGHDPEAAAVEAWRHNDVPPVPPMSVNQAIQALTLHHKTARLWAERPDQKRRRGESSDTHALRLALKWTAEKHREAEDRAVLAAAQSAGDRRSRWEPDAPPLPALDQVQGWSTAGAGAAHHPDTALFGGWRLGDWQRRGK